ncbi:oligopeptide transport system ATP-binding protein [Octadecabacter temperatus]|uniref:Oligopeptide transport ATP-binding protein OppF n=1 Tax=Octadecabacter temperatus TaxID=1458307 RepID=A0A0K0Y4V1_9RHOB|nr:oligopeptide/dipeptide ABC transporter ATP-binding protein [Octadecabacter temperatus]AKS45862.1 Oligopeptide transport ATP-binding protein OppF [Octadecabacter temperatus]SIO02227.1 oligopeptide transport system ATP-binding protein [Octadecabacter temperatus]
MTTPMLAINDLNVTYPGQRGLFVKPEGFCAVDGVSLSVAPGQTFGLVGESGSGKSTVARAVLQLAPVTSGQIILNGKDVSSPKGEALKSFRREVQAVFQDPTSALNPSMTIGDAIAQVLKKHHLATGTAHEQRQEAARLLDLVQLPSAIAGRLPSELSGGQRQRIAIARALAVQPKVILCDEPTSALDVSVAGQIVNLFRDLQAETGVTYLFISHDLGTVRHISQRIGVMLQGRLVEEGPTEQVFANPQHPYTKMLVASTPVADPERQRLRADVRRNYGSAQLAPRGSEGCPFRTRCPEVMDICHSKLPEVEKITDGGQGRCHLLKQERS